MMTYTLDSLGRRRAPGQNRGLRPLYPQLPANCRSRAVRIAMAPECWEQIDHLLEQAGAETKPRALGELLARALLDVAAQPAPEPRTTDDWQNWQIRKELELLTAARAGSSHAAL